MTASGESPLDWTSEGLPRSRLYGDVYFSSEDGLAETRAVFLDGCGLPAAWAGRRRFVVGELGFGTGLNIAALLELWRRTRPPEGRLHVFSVEAHPISPQDAARALGRWPELAEVTTLLAARWPGRARGVHRVDLPEFAAVLDVAILDVATALERWDGRADAWFLDGFAPAANPQMWRDEVLALVAQRSAPGARAATFTVAGQVRRGLAAAGFEVEKKPGFGRKRERLEARLPGEAHETPARRAAIVGGGIAGAAAARAGRALGLEVELFEARRPGAGGSGNPGALVTPRLDAGLGAPAELSAQAFARAVRLYQEIPGAILERGVLQLAGGERDLWRFETLAAADVFEPAALAVWDAAAVADRLGEPGPAALWQAAALVVDPVQILQAWAPDWTPQEVASLAQDEDGWRLLDRTDTEVGRADAVILANAMAAQTLLTDLPLQPVRGQATWVEGVSPPGAAAWGGYVLPTRDGVLFGATHDRDDASDELREADQARNLATLAAAVPQFAKGLQGGALQGRAAVRAVTPDRLPLAGAAGRDGLYLLTGFGSRGFTHAPLLAEHVAAQIAGAPSPLPIPLAELVDPARFARRAARRGAS